MGAGSSSYRPKAIYLDIDGRIQKVPRPPSAASASPSRRRCPSPLRALSPRTELILAARRARRAPGGEAASGADPQGRSQVDGDSRGAGGGVGGWEGDPAAAPCGLAGTEGPFSALLYPTFPTKLSSVGEAFATDPFCSWLLPF